MSNRCPTHQHHCTALEHVNPFGTPIFVGSPLDQTLQVEGQDNQMVLAPMSPLVKPNNDFGDRVRVTSQLYFWWTRNIRLTVTGVEQIGTTTSTLVESVIEYKSQVNLMELQMNHTETMVRYSSGDLTDLTTFQYNKSPRNSDSAAAWWTEQVVQSQSSYSDSGTIQNTGMEHSFSQGHTITLGQVYLHTMDMLIHSIRSQ